MNGPNDLTKPFDANERRRLYAGYIWLILDVLRTHKIVGKRAESIAKEIADVLIASIDEASKQLEGMEWRPK
jgi:hypothetical protein